MGLQAGAPVVVLPIMALASAPNNTKLFNDAHAFLQTVSSELQTLSHEIIADHEERKMEILDSRRKLEKEKFERREQVSKLRSEFEDFVYRKFDKVIEEMEDMKQAEKLDDAAQQMQIGRIVEDMEVLKEDLVAIQASWGKLVSQCMTGQWPAGLE